MCKNCIKIVDNTNRLHQIWLKNAQTCIYCTEIISDESKQLTMYTYGIMTQADFAHAAFQTWWPFNIVKYTHTVCVSDALIIQTVCITLVKYTHREFQIYSLFKQHISL